MNDSKRSTAPASISPATTSPASGAAHAGGKPHRAPLPAITFDDALPVSAMREQIADTIAAHQVVILAGETGSGKTTQLPKICLQLGRGQTGLIGHTQPRRIAASTIAKRIAQELNTAPGELVGYKVRFTDQMRPGARVKLMTDGILLAESQGDPLLRAYDTVIIDEAHERSLNIDFLLGYLHQLLPKRPDLKLIITSATIDAERFAKHFEIVGKAAPIISVSGRLFPVELRWRPVRDADDADDRTLMDAICDAVDECARAGRGDILVFLPGEREIREAAEALRKQHPPGTELLPLFARLSAEEQERVFKPGGLRRIVLATNVAETSLTVPGIRYVVDTGLARVKRYSWRNKVEQLQIEPVSQAAANQRAGRCGRLSDGICIRLYDEADFAKRPRFTDPEVLRASLASVILRMKSLGLGDVRAFPFVEPPPARAIADGYDLLTELDAVDEAQALTPIGRELARLPLDPRVGRMLLAAREENALNEVLVIAAALSVQDVRDRPAEQQQAADQAHRKFAEEKSDFASILKLWRFLDERAAHRTTNRAYTDELKANFLSPRRVREWRDVHGQLMTQVKEAGWQFNEQPANYESLHLSLLAGLLGNAGFKTLDGDARDPPYSGARGIKFHVWPGSPLAKKGGRWLMAAELVETSRLYARHVATIEPQWLERVGAHLLKRSWGDPHWEKKPAQVMAFERATLYGMVVYAQRRVPFGPKEPIHAREVFIRAALVDGEYESQAAFFQHNRKLVSEIRDLEHKTRRPDVLVDDALIYAFYDARVPADVWSGSAFEKWRSRAERDAPKLLFLSRDELMRHEAAGITTEVFPKLLSVRGTEMVLNYHFEPGSARDGVTLAVPLFALNQVDATRCEWLVPGMLKEKAQVLLKSLPQKLRRHVVPLPDYAAGFSTRYAVAEPEDRRVGLIEALIADIRRELGVVVQAADFKSEQLPMHLVMNFKVVDEHGRQLAMGRSLPALRAELGHLAQKQFHDVATRDSRIAAAFPERITDWDFSGDGALPEVMEIHKGTTTLVGYPALVDRGDHCVLEVFDDAKDAQGKHAAGLRRLFRLQLREQVKFLEKSLATLHTAQLQGGVLPAFVAALPSFEALRESVIVAALDRSCLAPPLPADRQTFHARRDEARGRLSLIAQALARDVQAIATEVGALQKKLNGVRMHGAAVTDMEQQLARLFPKDFVAVIPAAQLSHYPRYLKALSLRIDRLKSEPSRDQQRMQNIAALNVPYLRELQARKGVADEQLTAFGWMLEELRVSLFAQELRTPMPVSTKRLEKIWATLRS